MENFLVLNKLVCDSVGSVAMKPSLKQGRDIMAAYLGSTWEASALFNRLTRNSGLWKKRTKTKIE